MTDETKVMGYVLGTHEGWDGDCEYVQFSGFTPFFKGWPSEAKTIYISYVDGDVIAYDANEEPIARYTWPDFVKMLG